MSKVRVDFSEVAKGEGERRRFFTLDVHVDCAAGGNFHTQASSSQYRSDFEVFGPRGSVEWAIEVAHELVRAGTEFIEEHGAEVPNA